MRNTREFKFGALIVSITLVTLYVMYESKAGWFASRKPAGRPVMASSKLRQLNAPRSTTQSALSDAANPAALSLEAPGEPNIRPELFNMPLYPTQEVPESEKRHLPGNSDGGREILMSSSKSKSELFTMPIKRATLLPGSKAPAGLAHIPYVNRLNNWGKSDFDNEGNPADFDWRDANGKIISRTDFKTMVEHYRARGLPSEATRDFTLSTTRPAASIPLPDPAFELLPQPTPRRTKIMSGSKFGGVDFLDRDER